MNAGGSNVNFVAGDIELTFLLAMVQADELNVRRRLFIAYRHWKETGDVSGETMKMLEAANGG